MKVFVAGATGVLGRAAIPALVAAGHDATGAVRSPDKAALVTGLGGRPVQIDLFDEASVTTAVAGHDVVCNFATHIPRFGYFLPSAWRTNDRLHRDLSRLLVDVALASGASRYLQHSVSFMYADGSDSWLGEAAPREIPPHGDAVVDAETSTLRFGAAGGAGIVLRFGFFYGASAISARDLVRLARTGFVPFPGRPDAYLTFVHVDDLGTSVEAAMSAPAGIYNVTDDDPLTRAEFAVELAKARGRSKPLRSMPRLVPRLMGKRFGYMSRSQRVSNARFKEAASWAPSVPTSRGRWEELVHRA